MDIRISRFYMNKTPNKTTQEALKEGRDTMKTFGTVEEMHADIEGYDFAPKQFAMKPMELELLAVWSSKGYDEREEAMEKFHSKLHALMTATKKIAIEERDEELVEAVEKSFEMTQASPSDNFLTLSIKSRDSRPVDLEDILAIIKNKNQT